MQDGQKKLPFVAAVLYLCLAPLSGCFLFPQEEEILPPPLMTAPDVTYRTVEAKIDTIADKIAVTGYFGYVQQSSLYFRYRSGRLKAIYVGYGESVSSGDMHLL